MSSPVLAHRFGRRVGDGTYLYVSSDGRTLFLVEHHQRDAGWRQQPYWRVSVVDNGPVALDDNGAIVLVTVDDFRQYSYEATLVADGFTAKRDAVQWATHYVALNPMVTSLDVLLQLTDCATAEDVAAMIEDESEWSTRLECDDFGVEVVVMSIGGRCDFPFRIDEFWDAVEIATKTGVEVAIYNSYQDGEGVRSLASGYGRSIAEIREALLEYGESPPYRYVDDY